MTGMRLSALSRYRDKALALWGVATLSFMAAMSITSPLFALCCLCVPKKDRKSLFRSPDRLFTWASWAYFLIAVVSIVQAHLWPPLGLAPDVGVSGLKKFLYFALPFLTASTLLDTSAKKRFERHILWRWLYWTAVFVSLVGIVQFWGSYLFPESWLEDRFFRVVATNFRPSVYHAQGLMYFHLSFASALGFVCSYAWARVLWPLSDDTGKERLAWLFLTLVSSLALFFAYSRIGWLALILIPILLGFLRWPRWGWAITAVFVLAGLGIWSSSSNMRERWNAGLIPIREREEVWAGALAMVRDRPLLGVGFGGTGRYSGPYEEKVLGRKPLFSSHAHNNVLDVLASTGILGLLAFLAWWIALARQAWLAYRASPQKERWLPAACLAALVAFQVNGLTQVNFADAKSQHSLMLWAGVVLALGLRRQQRK